METLDFWEISRGIFGILWLVLYWYYIGQVGNIEKGLGKRMLGFGLAAGCLALSAWIPPWLAWLLVTGVLFLYSI